jgi:hypothetical protein
MDFPAYMPMAGPSDDSAANPGMFTSQLQFQAKFVSKTRVDALPQAVQDLLAHCGEVISRNIGKSMAGRRCELLCKSVPGCISNGVMRNP